MLLKKLKKEQKLARAFRALFLAADGGLKPEAAAVLSDLDQSLADYRQAAFSGFTPEERQQYLALSRRLQENLQKTL